MARQQTLGITVEEIQRTFPEYRYLGGRARRWLNTVTGETVSRRRMLDMYVAAQERFQGAQRYQELQAGRTFHRPSRFFHWTGRTYKTWAGAQRAIQREMARKGSVRVLVSASGPPLQGYSVDEKGEATLTVSNGLIDATPETWPAFEGDIMRSVEELFGSPKVVSTWVVEFAEEREDV